MDLIGNASAEDLNVLFSKLDEFAADSHPTTNGFSGHFDSQFPTSYAAPEIAPPLHFSAASQFNPNESINGGSCSFTVADLQLPQIHDISSNAAPNHPDDHFAGSVFAMHQLHTAVNDLEVCHSAESMVSFTNSYIVILVVKMTLISPSNYQISLVRLSGGWYCYATNTMLP
jgi:hypothetical protein